METLKLNKKNVNKHYSLFYLNVLVCLNFKFTIEKGRKTENLKDLGIYSEILENGFKISVAKYINI